MPAAMSGYRTHSVCGHYNIVNEANLKQAAKLMTTCFEQEKLTMATVTVTPAALPSSLSR